MKGIYEKFARDNKGMFRVASVNCVVAHKICNKEGVSTFPHFKVYPPFPAPIEDFSSD